MTFRGSRIDLTSKRADTQPGSTVLWDRRDDNFTPVFRPFQLSYLAMQLGTDRYAMYPDSVLPVVGSIG